MDKRYELYCLTDPHFYDSPVAACGGGLDYAIAGRARPAGWDRRERDDWIILAPPDPALPRQGWKIHVSACLNNAEEILDEVWKYCVSQRLSFKFLRARHVLHMRNAKYANRGTSGKLATIYPPDERSLERVLTELGTILAGQPGPYILSDLRWGDGPLYVRYGGFEARFRVSERGVPEPAIEDPAGRLVPDRRAPVFAPPSWVRLPRFLEPHVRARSSMTVRDMPYKVVRPLHFSNGGGVYVAVDTRTGDRVVLKEARPHAGLAYDGADAVTRLTRERWILERLAGLPTVPRLRESFTLGGHRFLALDMIDGTPLNELVGERYPLNDPTTAQARVPGYTEWALGVYHDVERAVDSVHRRGVIFGDLHPFNIMVRPGVGVVLVDFEVASLADERRPRSLAHPGFAAPADREGFDIDRYALGCLRLALFLPITTLLSLDRSKAAELAKIIGTHFPVPRDFLDEAVEIIWPRAAPPSPSPAPSAAPGPPTPSGPSPLPSPVAYGRGRGRTGRATDARLGTTPDLTDWERTRTSLRQAIVASAAPDRHDRLFPGDIEQFSTGGLNIAHGAAGVLYALDATGAGRYPEYEQWLERQALRPPRDGTRLGLYDGLHGVAYVLDRLGSRARATDIIEVCLREKWERLGSGLAGGLAGIGLNLRHFAVRTGDADLRAAALWAADIAADRLGGEGDVPEVSGGESPYAGLFEGTSGPALLFIRMYEDTGDQGWLDRAATALGQDLRRCVLRRDGTLHVNEGWRTMPYLHRGGAGVGLALAEYLRHRHDQRFADAAAAIHRGVRSPLFVQSGLFSGRAGILAFLAWRAGTGRASADPDVMLQVNNLAWHALSYQGHLAFPGDQLHRLSMDLGTGSAGVLLALGAALHDRPVALPFVGVPGSSAGRPDCRAGSATAT